MDLQNRRLGGMVERDVAPAEAGWALGVGRKEFTEAEEPKEAERCDRPEQVTLPV